MFSIATVASSTRMPTASARPPSVMMLIVCPAAHSATTAESSANGIVVTTISALRQSRRNSSTIRPVSSAPSSPSLTSPANGVRHVARLIELEVDLDVLGRDRVHRAAAPARTRRITSSVEASARLVTGM